MNAARNESAPEKAPLLRHSSTRPPPGHKERMQGMDAIVDRSFIRLLLPFLLLLLLLLLPLFPWAERTSVGKKLYG